MAPLSFRDLHDRILALPILRHRLFSLARPTFVASKGNGELQGIDHGR